MGFISCPEGNLVTNVFVTEAELIDRFVGNQLWLTGSTLGDNSTVPKSSPVQTISRGNNWEDVSVSVLNVGAVKTDGTLWLWGYGNVGQLGNNAVTNRSSPVQTVSTGINWKHVSVGFCAVAALKTDGTLWMWGQGSNGHLGNNSTVSRSSPVQTASATTNWKQVAAGRYSFGSIKTDGTLWLWGRNGTGNLGDDSTINRSSPVQTVSTGTNWKQVSLGQCHSAAIKTDGTLWLWGRGDGGQLGYNNTITYSSPVQIITKNNNWKQINLGSSSSSGIKMDGTLWVWGCNNNGNLGTNDTINRSLPVQTITSGTNWKTVSMDNSSAAIKTDGTLWTWGQNNGRLGDNSTVSRSSPVQTISFGTNWKQVSVGSSTTAMVNHTDN